MLSRNWCSQETIQEPEQWLFVAPFSLVSVKRKDYSHILNQHAHQTLQITHIGGSSWNMNAYDSSTSSLVHVLADQIEKEFGSSDYFAMIN